MFCIKGVGSATVEKKDDFVVLLLTEKWQHPTKGMPFFLFVHYVLGSYNKVVTMTEKVVH